MMNAYTTFIPQGAKAYGMVARHIISRPPPGNGLIIHCTAGKDRTGVLGALLLQLAGVPDDIIVKEYDLTNQGLAGWMPYLVQLVSKQTGASEEAARRMTSARPESMAIFLQWLKEQGGAEGYFKDQCGLTEEEVERLKATLIVDDEIRT